jgi:glycosyltransferase involved in cell wall biosynthesis
MTLSSKAYLSIIIPIKDEEENIEPLSDEVTNALADFKKNWECIWVNDGSIDGSMEALRALNRRDPRHTVLSLKHNYGQSTAMVAGFRAARGALIATLDGDSQNDPADLPMLIKKLESGDFDMVNGYRHKRRDTIVRKISSKIANNFRTRLTGESVSDVGCSIRVFKRECLDNIPVFEGMHRFLPTLIHMKKCKITEVPVNHRPRIKGKTKYGINNRLWVGLVDTFAVKWFRSRLILFDVKEHLTDAQNKNNEKEKASR